MRAWCANNLPNGAFAVPRCRGVGFVHVDGANIRSMPNSMHPSSCSRHLRVPRTRRGRIAEGLLVAAAVRLLLGSGSLCLGLFFSPGVTHAQSYFTEVAQSAGVRALHWNGAVPTTLTLTEREMLYFCAGAAAADFDGDGWVDLYVTRLDRPNLLYRNRRDGTFEEMGAQRGVNLTTYSSGCVWGDVDNDGDQDLYVLTVTPSNRNYLYINDGSGFFVEQAIERGVPLTQGGFQSHLSTSAVFGDYNNDGSLDLFVTEWGIPAPTGQGASLSRNRLFRNDGSGFFLDVSLSAGVMSPDAFGFSPRFADIDLDGWLDILIAADWGRSVLLHNERNGTFIDVTEEVHVGTDENGMGAAVGDCDNDGDLDWFVTSIYDGNDTCSTQPCNWDSSGNRMYINDGRGVFSDHTDSIGVRNGMWGWGAAFFDRDNDGDLDLGMTNGLAFPWTNVDDAFSTDPLRLWDNDGNGHMREVSEPANFVDFQQGRAFLTFDYDHDGDLDVFITNNAGFPLLFRNESDASNGWLEVSLRGRSTNIKGIGVRIAVIGSGGTTMTRDVCAGSSFMSQDDVTAHFGLGAGVSRIPFLVVYWPVSGTRTILSDLPANRHVIIPELGFGMCDEAVSAAVAPPFCLSACSTGPTSFTGDICSGVDVVPDGHVDLRDYAVYQREFVAW